MAKLLLLGGTRDARQIWQRLQTGYDIIYSLAGRTKAPALSNGTLHLGGFGGSEGLVGYLRQENIDLVVDATHPFAAQMSRQAVEACDQSNIPLLRYSRPPWKETAKDRWVHVHDLETAADLAPTLGSRVFLTTGRKELAPFGGNPDCWWLTRVVEPATDLPEFINGDYIYGRGPFDAGAEKKLLQSHAIDLLITKNSGGDETHGKIAAAAELAIPVIVIDRPSPPKYQVEPVQTIKAVQEGVASFFTA